MWRILKETKRELGRGQGRSVKAFPRKYLWAESRVIRRSKPQEEEKMVLVEGPARVKALWWERSDKLWRGQGGHRGWGEQERVCSRAGGGWDMLCERGCAQFSGSPAGLSAGVTLPAVTVLWRGSGCCHNGFGAGNRKQKGQLGAYGSSAGGRWRCRDEGLGRGRVSQPCKRLNPLDQRCHYSSLSQGDNQMHTEIYIQIYSLRF